MKNEKIKMKEWRTQCGVQIKRLNNNIYSCRPKIGSNNEPYEFAYKHTDSNLRQRCTHKAESQRNEVAHKGYEAKKSHIGSFAVEPLLHPLYLGSFDLEVLLYPLYLAEISEIIRGSTAKEVTHGSRYYTSQRVEPCGKAAAESKFGREWQDGSRKERYRKETVLSLFYKKIQKKKIKPTTTKP